MGTSVTVNVIVALIILICQGHGHDEILGNYREDIEFLLWTRSNPRDHQTFVLSDNATSMDQSVLQQNFSFNPSRDTKVLIHGFRAFGTKHFIRHMRDAMLEEGI